MGSSSNLTQMFGWIQFISFIALRSMFLFCLRGCPRLLEATHPFLLHGPIRSMTVASLRSAGAVRLLLSLSLTYRPRFQGCMWWSQNQPDNLPLVKSPVLYNIPWSREYNTSSSQSWGLWKDYTPRGGDLEDPLRSMPATQNMGCMVWEWMSIILYRMAHDI